MAPQTRYARKGMQAFFDPVRNAILYNRDVMYNATASIVSLDTLRNASLLPLIFRRIGYGTLAARTLTGGIKIKNTVPEEKYFSGSRNHSFTFSRREAQELLEA